ncbi:MAG TPA: hypothetical protein VND24_07580, partial [Steroidobacteraceae bacterium]|nr:hypothetical protein [Steroidobacteraceae bacterium]
ETAGEPLLATLSNALAETALLLLLDNFEHLLPAAPVIAELLTRCPALVVLVTSRAPLHLRWEHAYPVHPLALPDAADLSSLEDLAAVPAVALFLERARAVRPDFSLSEESAAAVAAICRHLEGLPLALELAAARLRLLAPDMLLARLTGVGSAAAPDSPLQLLRGGPADAPARQQTLRDAIGWSYRLLSEGEQILVRRLAVFAGGCTLAAVEAVCGAAPLGAAEVLDGLAGLTDAALVHQEEQAGSEARYRMLELIREYAAERLAESGEAVAVRRRHADSCLALAEEAEPGLKSGQRELWLGRLDAELANIRAALAWSEADAASVETGLRLATALEWYWHFRNHWREGRDCLERLLTQAGLEVPVAARAKALYVSGQLAVFLTDYEQAGERLEASTVLFRELDDPHGLGYALCYRSRLEARRRNLDAARSLAEESAACFRRTGDSWGLALACNYIANAADRQDDVREARARAAESISLFRALGDT